jgi:hypothetical protein
VIDVGFRVVRPSQHVHVLVAPLARVALVEFEAKLSTAGAVKAEIEGIVGARHAVFADLECDPYPNQLPAHDASSPAPSATLGALDCCDPDERSKG